MCVTQNVKRVKILQIKKKTYLKSIIVKYENEHNLQYRFSSTYDGVMSQ